MGFKKTSATITVSNRLEQTVADDFAELELDLPLDTLNNEIFVVLAVDFGLAPSDIDPSLDTSAVQCQLSTTRQGRISGMETSQVICRGENAVSFATTPAGDSVAVPFTHMSNDTPTSDLPYIGLIATPNAYLAIDSQGQNSVKAVAMRIWGYRAKADAATYAALVQSEVLSS